MEITNNSGDSNDDQLITEGLAIIRTSGNVFYNPVQEFNRDLSISVISTYIRERNETESAGVEILEALSATGLRSIRYAKEIVGIRQITANDISAKAVDDIKRNISQNCVDDLVKPSHEDATILMYKNRKERPFDIVDIDPYGCPSIFLDAAVQSIKDGGLLLVTATDMAVLAGNAPETCYSKYGAISLRMKSCHEMALRILLKCIESHANRYGRYIVPLLSLSADFYIRVFVKVYTSAKICKKTLSKLATVYNCTGCGSFELQPLGIIKTNDQNQQLKYGLPTKNISGNCQHCNHPYHVGGPIWSAPIHCPDFVTKILESVSEKLGTHRRIVGVLSVIKEELPEVPLYYTLQQLSGTLHVETPPMILVRSAILNANFRVSYTHMNKTSIKTDATSEFIWDFMRIWESQHPVNKKRLSANSPGANILRIEAKHQIKFEINPEANPESRKLKVLRFQQNPQPNWGPGTRATAMLGGDNNVCISKSRKNQGKRKRSDNNSS